MTKIASRGGGSCLNIFPFFVLIFFFLGFSREDLSASHSTSNSITKEQMSDLGACGHGQPSSRGTDIAEVGDHQGSHSVSVSPGNDLPESEAQSSSPYSHPASSSSGNDQPQSEAQSSQSMPHFPRTVGHASASAESDQCSELTRRHACAKTPQPTSAPSHTVVTGFVHDDGDDFVDFLSQSGGSRIDSKKVSTCATSSFFFLFYFVLHVNNSLGLVISHVISLL